MHWGLWHLVKKNRNNFNQCKLCSHQVFRHHKYTVYKLFWIFSYASLLSQAQNPTHDQWRHGNKPPCCLTTSWVQPREIPAGGWREKESHGIHPHSSFWNFHCPTMCLDWRAQILSRCHPSWYLSFPPYLLGLRIIMVTHVTIESFDFAISCYSFVNNFIKLFKFPTWQCNPFPAENLTDIKIIAFSNNPELQGMTSGFFVCFFVCLFLLVICLIPSPISYIIPFKSTSICCQVKSLF